MTLFEPAHRTESLAARAALMFLQNAEAAQEDLTHAARREGLPVLQATLLVRSHLAGSEGVTVSALSEALHLTPPTVSDSLKALVRKGFLTRRRSPEDGRRVIFRPSASGIESAQRVMAWAGPLEDSLDRMTTDEQRSVMCALTRLLHDRVHEGYRVEEPMCASCTDFEVISWSEGRFRCRARQSWLPIEGLRTDCPGHSPWVEEQRPS
jgi:DNA-binding MarR family transcriptional regulator